MHFANFEIEILAHLDALSRRAAEIICGRITATLAARDYFTWVLCGGATPRKLYSLMATDAALRTQVPWEKIHFFWGDDRHVPPDHPQSNFRMADELMLSRVPVLPQQIHRIRTEDPDAGRAAEDYEQELRAFFRLEPGQRPVFDCVQLGLGSDGHTASLFPGTTAISEKKRLVIASRIEKLQAHRITLTAPVINNAAAVLFMVSGPEKAAILQHVLEGRRRPDPLPAQMIRPEDGVLLWLVDRNAASRLTFRAGSA